MSECNFKVKRIILYSAGSYSWDCSKRFSLYSLADIFNRIPSRLFWETYSHAAINVLRIFVHKYPPVSIARCSFILLGKLEQCRVNTSPNVLRGSTGFEPGFS